MSFVSRRAIRTASGRPRRVSAAGVFACLMSATLALGGATTARATDTTETVSVPSAPTGVHVTPSHGSLAVSWTPPGSDGGAALTGYQITASGGVNGLLGCDGGSGEMPPVGQTNSCDVTVTAGPSATSATITGLTDGRTYTVRVTAGNSAGWGPPSEPVSATPGTPPAPPSAPSGVTATAGNASATVTWSAPEDNGGAAVTSYTVTAFAGGTVAKTVVVDAPATSGVVDGLTNGTAYKFSVAATNAAGTGAASAKSAAVTPKAPTSSSSTSTTTSSTTTTTAPEPTTTTTTSTTTTTAPPVNVVAANARSGYWMVSAEGRVYSFGDALHHGEPRTQLGDATAADLEPTKSGNGYWVLDDTGRVFPYGDARWFGNANPTRLVAGEQATSLSRTLSGNGYWVFTNRGRVLTFGDAVSYGDVASVPLNGPVLDSIVTPSGKGYYMVASDGGIFAFGDAKFHGSMGGTKLNAPVQSLVPDDDGEGYWLVASDGGIFAFKAPFRGSLGGRRLNRPVSGMVPFGDGYLMVGEDGGIFNFSDRPFLGSLGANPPARPVVAVAVLEA